MRERNDAEQDRSHERRGRLGHVDPVRPEVEYDLFVVVQELPGKRHERRTYLSVAELAETLVGEAKVVADLVHHGDAHGVDHLGLAVATPGSAAGRS